MRFFIVLLQGINMDNLITNENNIPYTKMGGYDNLLITNENNNTLINALDNKINSYKSKIDLCIISGFFNAKAFEAIAHFKDKINSICIILGKEYQSINDDDIRFYLKDNILELYSQQLDDIKASKIAINFIKSHDILVYTLKNKSILIHSKMYFLHDKNNDNIMQNAIVGSSNFTASGLGLYDDKGNKELNLLCDSKNTTKECKVYFNDLLSQCEDSTNKVLDFLQTSYFYHSPKDVLDKIAVFFRDETKLDKREQEDLEKGVKAYNLFDFQKTAASELLKKLKNYGLALFADPVGSGKTLVALAVAFNYKRISIITPPKLKMQWESYKDSENEAILNQNIQFFNYDEAINKTHQLNFLQHSDLIIIDESHHFRNANSRYKKLKDKLCNNDSHLLLLSATPINNKYVDLAHQLTILKSHISIDERLLNPVEICNKADKLDAAHLSPEYYKLCNTIFARSSSEIEKHLKNLGHSLPKKNIEIKALSSVPKHIKFDIKALFIKLDSLHFCIYDPYKEDYLPQDIIDILKKEDNLENLGAYAIPYGFLSMSLIKALESSVDAFKSTLKHIITYYESFLNNERFKENEQSDEFPYRLTMLLQQGFKEDLKDKFFDDLKSDLDILKSIEKALESYKESDFSKSDKFQGLKNIINSKDMKKEKLIIFTESIITANALTKALKATFSNLNIESITGDTAPSEFRKRKERFSPHSLNVKPIPNNDEQIHILVATDCLSEGQNLQDCANLLNWDIAFNPVRAIQRIGRIWRIGSKHTNNHITHFFPNELEEYIKLEEKLDLKINALLSAVPSDSPFKNVDSTKHKELRKKYYHALENDTIAIEDMEDEKNSFASLQTLFENIKPNTTLKDGIFSLARSANFAENTLFALLQDKDEKSLYPCIFNLQKAEITAGISNSQKVANKIYDLKDAKKDQDLFSQLEDFTNNYLNIKPLKNIFNALIQKLNEQIEVYESKINDKKSDGGLIFSSEERKFRLIAWILINPNFNDLSKFKG